MSPYGNRIIGVERFKLPHLVSEFGRYAVTLRCANSLPKTVIPSFINAWRALKGETGKSLNQGLNRVGAFWQTEWYDRLIRDDAEYEKWKTYIAANPVKAGLCRMPSEYPFTYISQAGWRVELGEIPTGRDRLPHVASLTQPATHRPIPHSISPPDATC